MTCCGVLCTREKHSHCAGSNVVPKGRNKCEDQEVDGKASVKTTEHGDVLEVSIYCLEGRILRLQ